MVFGLMYSMLLLPVLLSFLGPHYMYVEKMTSTVEDAEIGEYYTSVPIIVFRMNKSMTDMSREIYTEPNTHYDVNHSHGT
jgi:hypothetical protein